MKLIFILLFLSKISVAQDCKQFAKKLKSCTPFKCYLNKHPRLEEFLQIIELSDGKCSTLYEEASLKRIFNCSLPEKDLEMYSSYFQKVLKENQFLVELRSNQILDSKKKGVIKSGSSYISPLGQAVKDKVCSHKQGETKIGFAPKRLDDSKNYQCGVANNKYGKAIKVGMSGGAFSCRECTRTDDCLKQHFCKEERCVPPSELECEELRRVRLKNYDREKPLTKTRNSSISRVMYRFLTKIKYIDRKIENETLACNYSFEKDEVEVLFKQEKTCPQSISLKEQEPYKGRRSSSRLIWDEDFEDVKFEFLSQKQSSRSGVVCLYKFSGKMVKRLAKREGPFHEDQLKEARENLIAYMGNLAKCKPHTFVNTHPRMKNVPTQYRGKIRVNGMTEQGCHETKEMGANVKLQCYYNPKVLKLYSKFHKHMMSFDTYSTKKKTKLLEILKDREEKIREKYCEADIKKGSSEAMLTEKIQEMRTNFLKQMINKTKEKCKAEGKAQCKELESAKKEIQKECSSGKRSIDKNTCAEMMKEFE